MARKKDIEDISFEEVHEIQKYGTYYSEESFWKKIAKVAKKMGATVIRPALTLYFVLRDEKVPARPISLAPWVISSCPSTSYLRPSCRSWASRTIWPCSRSSPSWCKTASRLKSGKRWTKRSLTSSRTH